MKKMLEKIVKLLAGGALLLSTQSNVLSQANPIAVSAKQHYSEQISSNRFDITVTGNDPVYVASGGFTIENIAAMPGSIELAVKNMDPGTEIWVIENERLDYNPWTNHWNPVFGFTASSSYETIRIPTTDTNSHFFTCMQIDRYNGAQVNITSPVENSSVAGRFEIEVKPGIDIFPLERLTLYANGNTVSPINESGTRYVHESRKDVNGPIILQASAANSLRLVNPDTDGLQTPQDDPARAEGWSMPMQVIASNPVFLLSDLDYASASTSIPVKLVSMYPIRASIDIAEHGTITNLITSGVSDPEIFWPFHYTHIDAELPGGLEAALFDIDVQFARNDAVMLRSTNSTPTNIVMTTIVDKVGVRRKDALYAFGQWTKADCEERLTSAFAAMAGYHFFGATTVPAWPSTRGIVQELASETPFYLEVRGGSKNAADMNRLYSIFENSRTSEFTGNGHGGTTYSWPGKDTDLSIGISAPIVAERLQNTSTGTVSVVNGNMETKKTINYKARLCLSNMQGCQTIIAAFSGMQWCDVFGSPIEINQDLRDDMQYSAFVGNQGTGYLSDTYMNFQRWWNTTARNVDEPMRWPVGLTVFKAMFIYNDVQNSTPTVAGSRKVVWLNGQRSNQGP